MDNNIIDWILEGDVSLQYLVHRDLLNGNKMNELRDRIPYEGWGYAYLSNRNENGHWGQRFYQPKWISSHYTLLELKNIGCPPTEEINETIRIILSENKAMDGGIDPSRTINRSDVCINGMFLNYACYYGAPSNELESIIDYVLSQQLMDGGFNCMYNRSGAKHSSLHSTISVLEGILEYKRNGYTYQLQELQKVQGEAVEFILQHRLYKSDKTGEVIRKAMTMFSYPNRWKYDVLRCLVYLADAEIPYDSRMDDAIELLKSKCSHGKWKVQNKHPGETFFEYEKTGQPSRINTYRALRVLTFYE